VVERVGDRAGGGVAVVGERAGAVGAAGRRVIREVGRAGCAFGDRVGLAGGDGDVEAVAAIEGVAGVGSVELRLEPIRRGCLAVRVLPCAALFRSGVERVGDRAGGGVAVVGERAGAACAQGRGIVGEIRRAGRAFRDRVGLAGGDGDVEAVAARERVTDV